MNIELDPQKAKALEEAAKADGKDLGEILSELVDRYLSERTNGTPPAGKTGWLAKVQGSFANDPAFDEIVRLGREFRESQK